MSGAELRAAFAPIATLPTVYNGTATGTPSNPVADPTSTSKRRALVTNLHTTQYLGVLWALRSTAAGDRYTGKTIADATRIAPGATLPLGPIDGAVVFGIVASGAGTEYSITISEA